MRAERVGPVRALALALAVGHRMAPPSLTDRELFPGLGENARLAHRVDAEVAAIVQDEDVLLVVPENRLRPVERYMLVPAPTSQTR